ncbi:MAG: hypothetical protein AB7F99_14475 [Vicinamibacterales bacterium]
MTAFAALTVLALPGAASAQDFNLAPTAGETTLVNGFEPDPHEVSLTVGGGKSIDASTGPSACYGFIRNAPDYRLQYTAGSYPLFISANSETDTTIIVNDPNGDWLCDDDSGGNLNPLVTIDSPISGQYDVWVGTFDRANTAQATLRISEIAGGDLPDPDLPPTYGSIRLNGGFEPDPRLVSLTAGGGDLEAADIDSSCVGSIYAAPDYEVTYSPAGYPLFFKAESDGDATLIVLDPDGNWICDDDSGGDLNPLVRFDSPLSGEYDVWVGSLSSDTMSATLRITEIDPGTTTTDAGGTMPNFDLPPTYGTESLTSGFEPDPHTVAMSSVGGAVDASVIDSEDYCAGYVNEAPDFRLNYTAGSYPLFVSTEGDDDLTLVINAPSGDWRCDDDSGIGVNPLIRFDNPESGQYDVWVGTYSSGGSASTTLVVTEIQPIDPSVTLPDTGLAPTIGTISLVSGFEPDPHSETLTAQGGSIDASNIVDGDGSCAGNVSAAPDFSLNYSDAGSYPLTFTVRSSGDTTLLINDANGTWFCDDDSAGNLDPVVRFEHPVDGRYDIWVGTFSTTEQATLEITELDAP